MTLGPDRWHEIRDLFGRLQARAGEKVKATTAACLHELAKILTPSQVAEDLLPVYSALLKGTEEVRERVFEHVEVIIASVPTEIGRELFQNLANSWQEGTLGGWRAREKLAWRIPSFLQTFAGWGGQERVLEMMKAALLDPFAAVRDGATSGVSHLDQYFVEQRLIKYRFPNHTKLLLKTQNHTSPIHSTLSFSSSAGHLRSSSDLHSFGASGSL